MAKSIRIADHLYDRIAGLATEERRSLAKMAEILIEQALALDGAPITKRIQAPAAEVQISTTPQVERRSRAAVTPPGPETPSSVPSQRDGALDTHFKPDPK